MKYQKIYSSHYDLDHTGKTLVTSKLQELIDLASEKHAKLIIEKGIYLISSLFLKSNMELHLAEGAVLLGTTEEDTYPIIPTRVAGIEMDWYAGIINIMNQKNVILSGSGKIDGQGPYWWRKYWGDDMKGGMRKDYDEKKLRWACDYDCMRTRNILVSNCEHVLLKDFTSYQSGFWNIHLLYSKYIQVSGIHIASSDKMSPSTDGIDVDSCEQVLIENCELACNDDSIAIKSGRDLDGLRVGKPCRDITIKNCVLKAGFGITLGSELSGGIENIQIDHILYEGTDCGFRIKSSKTRQGYIQNVLISNLCFHNVKYLFHICLNWNPNYCECKIPDGYQGDIPKHWKVLTQESNQSIKTKISNILIQHITADYDTCYDGISRAFHIEGFEEEPIRNVQFRKMNITCKEYGVIEGVQNISFDQVVISAKKMRNKENDSYDNR